MQEQSSFTWTKKDEAILIQFAMGALTADIAESVRCQIAQLNFESSRQTVSLDFGSVKFLTAAAVGKLVALHRELQGRGWGFSICNVRLPIYEVFRTVRLTDVLDIRPAEKNIMVVEDDEDACEILKGVLESQGYNVACASNGQEALDHLRQAELPSLILLDLNMNGMDGWQFRHEQRHDPVLASIPVVVLSGAGDTTGRLASLGAAGFLQKPYEFSKLLETIRCHC